MYSIKEKLKILREMLSPEAAEADIALLSRLAPGHEILSRARRCPMRYSEEVLYILLDKATKEDIRLHRRNSMWSDDVNPAVDDANESDDVNPAVDDANESDDVNPDGEDYSDVQLLKSELKEKESELIEKEEELEEREAELDDRDEELSKKESELKAVSEKKSSPKKKSTRKSAGRTSSIKTLKKQS